MASTKSKPSRATWADMEPPQEEKWGQVVQELVTRQQNEERQGLVTGLQADSTDQIYTGNSGDRRTCGPRGKTRRRKGWFKWLRRLKAREKNIPAHFYPDMESNVAGLEKLTLEEKLEEKPIYESTTSADGTAVAGRDWMDWRESAQK
uniref:Rev protein n=1 Tax=Visna/maedi virus EV1 TaxID=12750 RepID=A4GW63_9RETR|nr:rev protein [Visna/maedi virus EV1]